MLQVTIMFKTYSFSVLTLNNLVEGKFPSQTLVLGQRLPTLVTSRTS